MHLKEFDFSVTCLNGSADNEGMFLPFQITLYQSMPTRAYYGYVRMLDARK